jgi:myo-inositol catabolism protein IolC
MTPPRDQRSWDSIERVIAENSPFCQGVVVSAQNILNAQLPFLLQSVGTQKHAKGFVLNRSILQPLLEAFFAEQIDEDTFTERMAEQFMAITALWKKTVAKSEQTILA